MRIITAEEVFPAGVAYFPNVKALSDVDFRLMKGGVRAIMGQNGDGKS